MTSRQANGLIGLGKGDTFGVGQARSRAASAPPNMPSSYRTETEREPSLPSSELDAQVEHWQHVAEEQCAILDALPLAVGLVRDRRIIWVNPAFTALLGYSREEAQSLSATAYFADVPRYEQSKVEGSQFIARGETHAADLLMRKKNGELFWANISSRLLFSAHPEVGILWALTDLTERKQIEEALKLSQARLEVAQAQAKIGSWEYNPATDESLWSKQMYALLGFDPAQGVPPADKTMEHVHPEDRAAVFDAPRRAIELGRPYRLTYRGNPSFGNLRYLEVNIAPEYDEAGQLCRLTGTTQDVTEREQATEALRDSEQRLQRLVQNSNDLIVVLDANGTLRSQFGPLKAIVGYEPGVLAGTNALALIHPEDSPKVQSALLEAMAHPGVPYRVEYRYRHAQGSWVEMEAVGTNWLNDPNIEGIVLNLRQITERKQAERERLKLQEQLQQTSKMEAVGRLAGGVAHDFNNLLTVITGNAELALNELDGADPLAQYLADVAEAASSAASLTRQLLAFSRRQLIEPKVVNLNELIGNLSKMLGRLIGEDIALEMRLCDELGSVRIDPGQFDQVVINLAVNARDALPKGGRLTLETANIELDDTYCHNHRDLKPGSYVRLSVTDSGEGMSAELLNHIFEPFFTTKPLGSGTGLGLSVIFGVVKQAGGAIETYSELGHGTTFKIYLPRDDAPAQRIEKARPSAEALRGTETILLVEDNESVRALTATILRRLGYELLLADNGKNALALIESHQPKLDLLLTDLVMPEMSGRELSARIRERYPNIAVLYCSGYTEDTFVRHGLASENLQFIGKPFTLQQLGLKVRQVLEERRSAI